MKFNFIFLSVFTLGILFSSVTTFGMEAGGADKDVLMHAVANGNLDIVKALLAMPGIDVNRPDTQGLTPLLIAVRNGNLDIVKALLSMPGIDVNRADNYGSTPPCACSTIWTHWCCANFANKTRHRH